MDYTFFQQYPLNILGIDESYNDELKAIEQVVIDEIDYSGDADDIVPILPYFVFYRFCEDKQSIVSSKGEMSQVAEFSVLANAAMIRAWNMGARMLLDACTTNEQTASEIYQSKISMI
jgi:hypothetical protein